MSPEQFFQREDYKHPFPFKRLNGKLYILDAKGNITDRSFDFATDFSISGVACVSDSTGAFHINREGDSLYPERYEDVSEFKGNWALVTVGDQQFHINKAGELADGTRPNQQDN